MIAAFLKSKGDSESALSFQEMPLYVPRQRMFSAVVFASLAVLLIAVPAFSQPASSGRALSNAQILGAEDPSKQCAVGSDPSENCFTLTRTGIGGTMAAVFGVKKEIPV
jgi:hypothetical protein